MRLSLSVTAILALTYISVPRASAEPLVTISCDKPNGFSIEYGTTLSQRIGAHLKEQPPPPPALTGPNTDGYRGKPTFVIDTNKKNMTVIWAELPEDAEARKKVAKESNLPTLLPPPATQATIVFYIPDQISAIDAGPWSIVTYSFFPQLGAAFIGHQSMEPGSKTTTQLATFAHCEFSWTKPK